MQKFKTISFLPVDSDKILKVQILQGIFAAMGKVSSAESDKIERSAQLSVMNELGDKARKNKRSDILFEIWNDNFPETPIKHSKFIVSSTVQLESCFRDSMQDVSGNISNCVRSNPKAKQQAQWLLQNGYRVLNSKGVSRVLFNGVIQAFNENDIGFLKALGRHLATSPKSFEIDFSMNPLKRLMLYHWVAGHGELQLCVFTDQALADFLNRVAPLAGATFDGVRSTRKRLKLLRTKPLLVKEVTLKGDAILLS